MKSILAALAILALPAAASAQIVPPFQFQPVPQPQPVPPIAQPRPYQPQPIQPFGGGFTATTHQFGDISQTQIQGNNGESATCRTVNFGGIVRTTCN